LTVYCLGSSEQASGAGTPYRAACLISLFLAFVMLLFTRSIAAIGSMAAAYLILRFNKNRVLILIALLCGFAALKLTDPEILNRLLWWKTALIMIIDNPLTGVGPGNFENAYTAYRGAGLSTIFAHNFYLQFCVETGIPGVVLLCSFLYLSFKKLSGLYMKAAVLGSLILGFFDYGLFIPSTAILFWFVLSIGFNMEKNMESNDTDQSLVFKIGPYIGAFAFLLVFLYVDSVARVYASVDYFNRGTGALKENAACDASMFLSESVSIKNDLWYAYGSIADINLAKYHETGMKSELIAASLALRKGLKYNP
jgi:hypothetical protein